MVGWSWAERWRAEEQTEKQAGGLRGAMSTGTAARRGRAGACGAAGRAGRGSLRPPAWLFLLWLAAGRTRAADYKVRESAGGKEAS